MGADGNDCFAFDFNRGRKIAEGNRFSAYSFNLLIGRVVKKLNWSSKQKALAPSQGFYQLQ